MSKSFHFRQAQTTLQTTPAGCLFPSLPLLFSSSSSPFSSPWSPRWSWGGELLHGLTPTGTYLVTTAGSDLIVKYFTWVMSTNTLWPSTFYLVTTVVTAVPLSNLVWVYFLFSWAALIEHQLHLNNDRDQIDELVFSGPNTQQWTAVRAGNNIQKKNLLNISSQFPQFPQWVHHVIPKNMIYI